MEEQKTYYVYRFKDNKENILYVGRTHNLEQRFRQHEHLTDNITKIEYIECLSETDMVIKEIYYINLYINDNSTNVKDVYDKPIDYGFNDEWKEYVKSKPAPKQPRKVKTVFNTPDFEKWSVIKMVMYCGDMETDAYITHYDKDIKKLKYSTYLYEAELFNNIAAYHISEDLNRQKYIEEEKLEELEKDKEYTPEELKRMALDAEYGYGAWDTGVYYTFSKFEYEYDHIQKKILEDYLKENNITLKNTN